MKALFKALWPFGDRYEVRMLNRDARYVIDDALGRFGDERLTQMANAVREYRREAIEQLEKPNMGPENVLPYFQDLHRTARKERQDMGLSAITLIIIFLRAKKHPGRCDSVFEAIDDFVAEFASDADDDAPTGQVGRLQA